MSAGIPSGNYLQIPCLRCADRSKFWGAGVGLFPGVREGEDATLFAVFCQCFWIQRFSPPKGDYL